MNVDVSIWLDEIQEYFWNLISGASKDRVNRALILSGVYSTEEKSIQSQLISKLILAVEKDE
jgi:hypothetical protein